MNMKNDAVTTRLLRETKFDSYSIRACIFGCLTSCLTGHPSLTILGFWHWVKTCARTRLYGDQILAGDHFRREHTKPLMSKYSIMNIYNLYQYCCATMCLKIFKFRSPISLYSMYNFSNRKPTLLILPREQNSMVYLMGRIWNEFRKVLTVDDFSAGSASLKSRAKSILLARQHFNNPLEWDKSNSAGFLGFHG